MGKSAKNDFKRKNGFESSFYKIDVVVTNWSVRLEKHETIGSFLMVDFLHIFINVTFFKIFRDF